MTKESNVLGCAKLADSAAGVFLPSATILVSRRLMLKGFKDIGAWFKGNKGGKGNCVGNVKERTARLASCVGSKPFGK